MTQSSYKEVTNRKILFSSLLGNMLEFYDFTLYGFFVAILSPLYFPASDPFVSLLSGFSVFALGFLTRPLGALFFGYIGDQQGRKKALSLTLFGISAPTVAIGLLPTYDQIGIAAPTLLIIFRLIQGFCAGGEYNGSGIFIVENSKEGYRGFLGGLLTSSGSLGAFLACIIGVIFINGSFPQWFWRIPFLLGGVICFVALYLRNRVKETIVPVSNQHAPILTILRQYPRSLLICVLIGGTSTVPFYIILTFINSSLMTAKVISSTEMMGINAIMQAACIFSLPLMGRWGDKIGLEKMMLFGVLTMTTLAYPLFYAYSQRYIPYVVALQFVTICMNEAFAGPSNAYMSQLFPKQYRYTGVAFGYCLGLALFGGTAPYVASTLIQLTQNNLTPAICILYGSFMGFIAVILGRRVKKEIIPY